MITIEKRIDRTRVLWQGVNKERVGDYIKMLSRMKKDLNSWSSYETQKVLNVSGDLLKKIERAIDEEIALCKFYFEFLKRQAKEKNFNEWVHLTKEQRKEAGEYDWQIKGDCWTKTNGKVRARITIDRESGVMAGVELGFENDSGNLTFFDGSHGSPHAMGLRTHRKTEKGITEQIEVYKQRAEEALSEIQYPHYCSEKNMMDCLKELLHVGRC